MSKQYIQHGYNITPTLLRDFCRKWALNRGIKTYPDFVDVRPVFAVREGRKNIYEARVYLEKKKSTLIVFIEREPKKPVFRIDQKWKTGKIRMFFFSQNKRRSSIRIYILEKRDAEIIKYSPPDLFQYEIPNYFERRRNWEFEKPFRTNLLNRQRGLDFPVRSLRKSPIDLQSTLELTDGDILDLYQEGYLASEESFHLLDRLQLLGPVEKKRALVAAIRFPDTIRRLRKYRKI